MKINPILTLTAIFIFILICSGTAMATGEGNSSTIERNASLNYQSSQTSSQSEGASDTLNVQGYWINPTSTPLNTINVTSLQDEGITDVFISTSKSNPSSLQGFITKFNNSGIRVHAWVTCFYNGTSWTDPGNETVVNEVTNSIINIATNYNVDGIHLDATRYPEKAYLHNGTIHITNFVENIYNEIQRINSEQGKDILLSAALMPECGGNGYHYGQNYTQLAPYLDFMVPMIYKGNYNAGRNWIISTTQYIVNAANGTPVVAGLQTYMSDTYAIPIPSSELDGDIQAALDNGSSGYVLFRYGLTDAFEEIPYSYTNLTDILDAATWVKNYIRQNGALPSAVLLNSTSGTHEIDMPLLLSLLARGLLYINNDDTGPIGVIDYGNPPSPTATMYRGTLTKVEYIGIATRVSNFMNAYGRAPNFASINSDRIHYQCLIEIFSKLLDDYRVNGTLPLNITLDTTPPQVTGTNPKNGVLNVTTFKNITVTFNESIKMGSGLIELKDDEGNPVAIGTSINGTVLTITHPNLKSNTKYILTLHPGSVTDLAGNPSELTTINFTTIIILDTAVGGDVLQNPEISANIPLTEFSSDIFEMVKQGSVVLKFGNGNGPKVLIAAGIHGNEPEANIATMKYLEYIKDTYLNGTLYVIPFVIPQSTAQNNRLYNGEDPNRNSNEPGTPGWNVVQFALANGIEYLLDVHSGGEVGEWGYMFLNSQARAQERALAEHIRDNVGSYITYSTYDNPGMMRNVAHDGGINCITMEVERDSLPTMEAAEREYKMIKAAGELFGFNTPSLNVIRTDPANRAVNVPANKEIKVTFNKNIKAGTLWIELKNSTGKAIPFTYSISGKYLTIKPTSNLAASKYTLTLHTGCVTDLEGIQLELTNFTFTVPTPPQVTGTNPVHNATKISLTAPVIITFNKDIKAGSNYSEIYIKNTISGVKVAITKTINGNTLTIQQTTSKLYDTTYQVYIPAGAITDTAGNILNEVYTYKFTTIPKPDTTPPTVTTVDPTNNKVINTANKALVITFSENIKAGSAFTSIKVTNPDGVKVNPLYKVINGKTLTLTRNGYYINGLTYTITLPTGSITDQAGNGITAFTSKFKVDTTKPTITSVNPTNNMVINVANKAIVITFSENIKAGSAFTSIKVTNPDGVKVNPLYKVINGKTLTLTRNGYYINGLTYTITLPTGSITDTAGNTINTYTSKFKIDFVKPTITSANPKNNSSGFSLTAPITITFSENITGGTKYSGIYMKNLSTGKVVSITKSISGKTLTIKMVSGRLSKNTYQIYLPAGAVKDAAGNSLASAYTLKFKTI